MTQELIKKIKNLIKNNKYLEAEKLIDSYSESSDLLISVNDMSSLVRF